MAEQASLAPGALPMTGNRHFAAMQRMIEHIRHQHPDVAPEQIFVLCAVYQGLNPETGQQEQDWNPIFGGAIDMLRWFDRASKRWRQQPEQPPDAAFRELVEEAGLVIAEHAQLNALHQLTQDFMDSTGYNGAVSPVIPFTIDSQSLVFGGIQQINSHARPFRINRRKAKVLTLVYGPEADIRSKVELLNAQPGPFNDSIVRFCMVPLSRLLYEYEL